jgi:type IV secretory pathway VirB10-like protein
MGGFDIKVHFIGQDKEMVTSDADPDVITEVLLGAYVAQKKLDPKIHWSIYDQDLGTTLDPKKTLEQNGVKDGHHLHIRRPEPPVPALDDSAKRAEAERQGIEQERQERERAESERQEREKAEKERKAWEKAEQDRLARARAEAERQAAEQAEIARMAQDKAAREEREKEEAKRQEAQRAPRFVIVAAAVLLVIVAGIAAYVFWPKTPVPRTGTQQVQVKNLVGKSLASAEQYLREEKLRFKSVRKYDDSYPAGTVIGQNPPPGAVDPGTEITLTVSNGPIVRPRREP